MTSLPSRCGLAALPAAGGPGGGDDHGLGLGEPVLVRGEERERDGGRVATGHRDPLGPLKGGAGTRQFGEPVRPGSGVRGAVVRLPVGGLLEPEVGAHVDDEDVRAELLGDGGGLAVRQGEEDDIVPGELVGGGGHEDAVGERQQVGLKGPESLAGCWSGRSGRRSPRGGGREADAGALRPRIRSHPPLLLVPSSKPSSWMA